MALSPEIIQMLNPCSRRAERTEAASGRRESVVANCATSLKVVSSPSERDNGRKARSATLFPADFHVDIMLDWSVVIGVPREETKVSLPMAASYRASLAD